VNILENRVNLLTQYQSQSAK